MPVASFWHEGRRKASNWGLSGKCGMFPLSDPSDASPFDPTRWFSISKNAIAVHS